VYLRRGEMSTYIYLECRDHTPVLKAEDESGQHMYDLPSIKALLVTREQHIRQWGLMEAQGICDPEAFERHYGYFGARTIRFLRAHPTCRIGIRDEYGVDLMEEDE